MVKNRVKWPQPFEPPIHLDKSYDLDIPLEFEKIDTC
jgi:hypothetical protein